MKHRACSLPTEATQRQSHFWSCIDREVQHLVAGLIHMALIAFQQEQRRDAMRARVEARRVERLVSPPISVLTRAFKPSKPDPDHRMLFTAIALAGALVLGALAALLGHRRQGAMAGPAVIR